LSDAEAQIQSQGWLRADALVVGKPDYNVGIVGIVAGKLAERHGCPVVVYGAEAGIARGSVRGPHGAPLYDLVRDASDCLIRFGGHSAAAGLELELGRVDEFRGRFVQASRERLGATGASANAGCEVLLLEPKDHPMRVAKELRRLEPCGEGNRLPSIGVMGRLCSADELRGGHLRLEVQRDNGDVIGGFGPNLGERAANLVSPLIAIGALRVSNFAGRERAELLVSDVVPCPAESTSKVSKMASSDSYPDGEAS
jgi:single-stranded-DNA-specific exonuclease